MYNYVYNIYIYMYMYMYMYHVLTMTHTEGHCPPSLKLTTLSKPGKAQLDLHAL